jgi:uncharacterized protein YcnI
LPPSSAFAHVAAVAASAMQTSSTTQTIDIPNDVSYSSSTVCLTVHSNSGCLVDWLFDW